MLDGYHVLLRDGGIAHVRPLRSTDREALHELVDRSSERSAYLRFFTGGRNTAHAYMDRVTSPAYQGHALVATVRDRLVAVAEYIPYHDGSGHDGAADFAEAGRPRAELELLRVCRTAGMRLIGPNCLDVINVRAGLNASFLPVSPSPGQVALMSQSGAVGAALMERLDVSSFVSVGNKADVSGNDLLEYWEDDEDTDVIALYLESFGNPRKFARIAGRVAAKKPILLVKSGRSGAGHRAVRSHTAAAATPGVAVDALARAAGVIRLDSVHDLIDSARLLSSQPLPAGRRVAIVGNSGGPEVMAADACEEHGLIVPELTDGLVKARGAAAVGNPVDLTADAARLAARGRHGERQGDRPGRAGGASGRRLAVPRASGPPARLLRGEPGRGRPRGRRRGGGRGRRPRRAARRAQGDRPRAQE